MNIGDVVIVKNTYNFYGCGASDNREIERFALSIGEVVAVDDNPDECEVFLWDDLDNDCSSWWFEPDNLEVIDHMAPDHATAPMVRLHGGMA